MHRKEKNENDVRYILEHLREEDRHEAIIQKGENYVEECLKDIMDNSEYFVLGCKKSDDTPVCMGGCTRTNEQGVGIVWLLTTPEIVKHQRCLLRNIKKEIENFDEKFWMTCNFLYKKNRLAKKWLSKFGYIFETPLGMEVPDNFEFFYRKRYTRGLNNGASTTI